MAKRKSNDLQNSTKKTKDQATQTSLKTKGEVRCWKGRQFLTIHVTNWEIILEL